MQLPVRISLASGWEPDSFNAQIRDHAANMPLIKQLTKRPADAEAEVEDTLEDLAVAWYS